ncbi:FxSxx-COOH cyclophane-containing RiPP peptide [Nonomuraea sp. NPDC048916]|uniref:FxSxx-COOH cyclophane-containing RiPP peptide n=1 Tax=Nonomuraea sp. NPDC048916 TaxID=3154232 RepID=UPI0034024B9D
MGEKSAEEYGGGLIDVSGLSLSDLDALDQPSLALALRRLVEDAGSGPVAGFQSAL